MIFDVEKLVQSKKIDPYEYKIFCVFSSPQGHELLMEMKERSFMEAPIQNEFSDVMFAWCDGRKSVIRELLMTVEKVRAIIKENNYVGGQG